MIIAGVVILFIVAIVILSIFSLIDRKPNKIELLVSPINATVKLDGKEVKQGEIGVDPGEITVEASAEGYSSVTETHIVPDETPEPYFIGLVLNPESDEAQQNALTNAETYRREEITGQFFGQGSKKAAGEFPLISNLPYIGQGREFRIDYEAPSDPILSARGVQTIVIWGYSEQARQKALNWIQDQGFFLADYQIVFKDYRGPIIGSKGE